MLDKDITELSARATNFLGEALGLAADSGLEIVSLTVEKFVFIDLASGIRASCTLLEQTPHGSGVASKSEVGEPGIKFSKPKVVPQ